MTDTAEIGLEERVGEFGSSLRQGLGLRDAAQPMPVHELAHTLFPWTWAPFQNDLLDQLTESKWRRMILLAAPRHRKSTCVAIFVANEVGKNPNLRVMVASHTRDFAALLISQVVEIMKTPLFKRSYGNLIPGTSDNSKWSAYEKHIPNRPVFLRDPTFLALSPESGTPGFGADLIIVDDLCTQANSSSPTMRAHLLHWFKGSLLKRLEPNGRILVIGARFYKEDIYGHVLSLKGWKHLIYPASPEAPLWPEIWPSEALALAEQDDPIFFPAQYLQDPIDISISGFLNREWFNYYLELPPNLIIYGGIDANVVKSARSSKFAKCVVGRDSRGSVYLLDAYSAHHSIQEQPDLIDAMYLTWHPQVVAWETDGTQEAQLVLMQKVLKNPVNLVGRPSLISKPLKMASLAGHVRSGKVMLKGEISHQGTIGPAPGPSKIVYEAWGNFPAGDVDLLDAFQKACSLALEGPPAAAGTQVPGKNKQHVLLETRFPDRVFHSFGADAGRHTRIFATPEEQD